MKKYILTILSIVLLSACTKEYEEQNTVESLVFHASVENTDETRVHLNESLMNRWDKDDSVSIFVGTIANQLYKFDGETGDDSGSFSMVGSPSFASGKKLNANYAVYPYRSSTSISEEGVISYTFPSVQSYAANSYGLGANTMVAITENTSDFSLLFKNTCGYLRVSLYGYAKISSITLKGNNGEKIAGLGTITASYSDVPFVSMSSTATETITINCGEGVQIGNSSPTATDFYFAIPPVEFSQGITITAMDAIGKVFEKSTTKSITITRNKIQKMAILEYHGELDGNIDFADANFKAYCVENFDTDGDGEISYAEADVVKTINCSGTIMNPKEITSLDGIKFFSSLQTLDCHCSMLTNLDVSNNTALTHLTCSYSHLTSLDVSKNTALTYLSCGENQLTSLDVSKNTALLSFYCDSNQLTSLDVSHNTALSYFGCGSNQLTSLDISKNTALAQLRCSSNQLTSLDVSKNTALKELDCYNNQLTSLDVSKNTALKVLNCSFNPLTSLDVSKNTALIELRCGPNQLTSLDVSKNTALTYLSCGENQITSLDVSKNTALTTLHCSYNQLTSLDVSKNTALIRLYCYSNQLTCLDVSKNTALTSLDCSPMNDGNGNNLLQILYISNGQTIKEITSNRNSKYIPDETVIKVIGEPEYVDLGLSVKWATFNLGATKPEEPGLYYQWGDIIGNGPDSSDGKYFYWGDGTGKSYYKWCNGSSTKLTKYKGSDSSVLELADDAANANWGGSWRMPTYEEWTELLNTDNCTWTWTSLYGLNGYKVQSLKSGYTDNWIFLPAAGGRYTSYSAEIGTIGQYWSSSLIDYNPTYAHSIYLEPNRISYGGDRFRAMSVRPVIE